MSVSKRLYMEPENWQVHTETGCWEWKGYIDRNGYGRCYDASMPAGRRFDWAHRVSYRMRSGEIPPRYEIDHTCEFTRCVNPNHLDAVTRAEHIRRTMQRLGKDELHLAAARLRSTGLTYEEIAVALKLGGKKTAHEAVKSAVRKGLISPGEVPPASRLGEADREDIRVLYAFGVPQTELAAWYGVDSSQVSRICAGRSSGHAAKGEAA